ncbi:hypothetical protein AY599_28085 [Leptolyngbya valderiana BDU 20041]|nr:hypothetical protein AY599_28085 [Leptolyngbya valderiana BDU 20041]
MGADGVRTRGGDRISRLVWGERVLLSRALCHYEVIAAPVGANTLKVAKAARMAARARTPVAEPQFCFDRLGDRLGVWSWPASAVSSLDHFEGEVLPETMLHAPAQDGPRLAEVMDGVEGQVWRGGHLTASRWWPAAPTQRQWSDFLRASRCETGPVPAPTPPALLDQPRSRPRMIERLERLTRASTKDIAALALLLLLAPTLFLAGQWAHLSLERAALRDELETLSAETSDIRQARQQAQDAASRLNRYAARLNHRHPSAVLAEVTDTAATFNVEIETFEQTQRDVTADLRSEAAFPADDLVRRMEAIAFLSNVRIEPGQRTGDWTLTADLEPVS